MTSMAFTFDLKLYLVIYNHVSNKKNCFMITLFMYKVQLYISTETDIQYYVALKFHGEKLGKKFCKDSGECKLKNG